MRIAKKRLPMPASGKRMETCSGVSIMSWSGRSFIYDSGFRRLMISNRWIEQRKGAWSRLDALTNQVESSGIGTLSGGELREFGLLYRQVAADLSAVRSDQASGTLEEYLNQLLSRAHNRIYSGRKAGFGSVVRFMTREYPRVFRQLFPYVLTSFL